MQNDQQPETPWEFKPGDTISPHEPTPNVATPDAVPSAQPEQPAQVQAPQSDQVSSEQLPQEAPQSPAQPESAQPLPTSTQPITWTASEFIAHSKSANWYLALSGIAIVIAALVYLLTRDKISTSVVIVAALALGVYAGRQPRQLSYGLDAQGITIGDRHFLYDQFRSFAIMDEGAFSSIAFLPLKRFGQLTTIYYDPKDEEAIVELLSDRLPLEQRQHDAVDRLMRRIKF